MNPSASLLRSVLHSMFAWLKPSLGIFGAQRRLGSRIEYASPAPRQDDADLVVGIIDDPELAMRLVSVRGELTSRTLGSLAGALQEVESESMLHLDMTDTAFTDPYAFSSLAGLL